MATTFVDYTGDGNATKAFSFPSIQESDIKVTVDEVLKSSGTHYNITGYTTTGGGNVVFTSGNIPASPAAIRIFRDTSVNAAKVTYTAGSSVKAEDLNANHEQLLFAVQEEQNIVSSTTTVKGFISAADKVKLDGIETAATADQTAAEIRTLVESATDSNVFTDADHTKLNAIEAGATGDQTNAEIKTAYEANSNTNAFTDAEKTKLSGIEASATGNQTNAEIKTAYEANSDTNAFTDAEKTKLSGIAAGAEVNVQADFNASSGDALILNKPSIPSGLNDLTDVDTTGVADNKILKYQASSSKFVIADDTGGGGGSSTFTGLSDTPTNYTGAAGKTLKVNSGGNAIEFVTVTTPTQDIVDDTTPQLGGNLDVQAREINTSTTNGNIKVNPNGTGVFEVKGNTNAGTLQLNCENNSHGVKIKGPAHSAGATYTLTLPVNDGNNNQVLKTDGSGVLAWVDQTTDTDTTYSAGSGLTLSGTTFSVNTLNQNTTGTSGGFTAGNASNLNAGTIPDARFPATLPAISGANLTGVASTTAGGAIYENSQTISTTHTIPSGSNGMSAGPVTVNNGITLTISSGSTYTVV